MAVKIPVKTFLTYQVSKGYTRFIKTRLPLLMARLTNVQRERAIGMLNAGMSKCAVARIFNCTRATIYSLCNRLQQTGSTSDRPRPGAARVTSRADDQRIRLLHLRNRQQTATRTCQEVFRGRISPQTIRNRLRHYGLRSRRPYVGPVLRQRHRIARVNWSQQHAHWTQQRWNRVLFTDESRFNVSFGDGRTRVWRRTGERYTDACVSERDRFGGGSCMVWGGIIGNQKTPLLVIRGNLTARRYIDEVLNPIAIPFIARQGANVIFQQDNATAHSAALTTAFLNNQGINVLPWPSRSPDLNCIEHLWDELGKRVRNRQNPPQNVVQLEQALVDEWRRIPANVIRRLTRSMRRRCLAVVNANGGHTRY